MFTSTRLKLTTWYLLIIMSISVIFSVVIFYILSHELDRNYRRFYVRFKSGNEIVMPTPGRFPIPTLEDIDTSKNTIKIKLLYINLFIFGISATAGYFLAGRTLRPIKEMMDEQNRFITDASHELKTPLTSLRTSLEVNLRDKKLDLKQAKSVLKSNWEEIVSLQNLSESLLILATSQNVKNEIRFEKVMLKSVINEVVRRLSSLTVKKKIKIILNIQSLELMADKEMFVCLILILLDNAIKYSSANSEIKIQAKAVDHKVKIEIKDTGIGISQKDLPFIFDRFYRADKSRSKTEGYGLGLSIAKKIIQMHKGEIEVKSKLGKGSTFSLYLPK